MNNQWKRRKDPVRQKTHETKNLIYLKYYSRTKVLSAKDKSNFFSKILYRRILFVTFIWSVSLRLDSYENMCPFREPIKTHLSRSFTSTEPLFPTSVFLLYDTLLRHGLFKRFSPN